MTILMMVFWEDENQKHERQKFGSRDGKVGEDGGGGGRELEKKEKDEE